MKRFFLIALLMSFAFAGFSQKVVLKSSTTDVLKLTNKDRSTFTVQSSWNVLYFGQIETKGGDFAKISGANLVRTYDVGNPLLPAISKLIEVPQGANVKVTVLSYDEEII